MRSLADEWQCDPSNATWIVNRLEELGLAQRQPVLHDRRVKLVVLTRKGEKIRTALLDEFHQPPQEFDVLQPTDLEALDRVLAKLMQESAARVALPGDLQLRPKPSRRPRPSRARRKNR
jgi:DNA-binding MarR family transcriptional regulator